MKINFQQPTIRFNYEHNQPPNNDMLEKRVPSFGVAALADDFVRVSNDMTDNIVDDIGREISGGLDVALDFLQEIKKRFFSLNNSYQEQPKQTAPESDLFL
jgi:hypothetical protein